MNLASRRRAPSRWAFPLLVGGLLAAWTLSCLAGWLLVQASATLLAAGNDRFAAWPELLWWTAWTLRLLEMAGTWLLGVGWAFGALGIVFGAWFGRRLWRAIRGAMPSLDPVEARGPGGARRAGHAGTAAAHPAFADDRRPAND
jgi:hypothetical protein